VERQAFFLKVMRAGGTGAAAAAINFACLWTFVRFFSPRVSFSLSFLLALAAHFILSKFWTFRDRSRAWGRQIWQYLLVAMISYLIQLSVFQSAMSFLGLNVFGANAAAILVGTGVSFLLMHSWVFSVIEVPPPTGFSRNDGSNVTTPRHDPPA
jgi:putative flippase GtrA